jgi:hypothetical protein
MCKKTDAAITFAPHLDDSGGDRRPLNAVRRSRFSEDEVHPDSYLREPTDAMGIRAARLLQD